ncbi:MAG: type 4b pilus protein PilO2 [Deltaproteobacteria bacterium]|jgi:hypothetical protein|nr:type 4b pilus protein PilO2 [Deltaproteobacteria bacterium]
MLRTTKIGQHYYALGLFWQGVFGGAYAKKPRKLALQRARELSKEKYNIVVIRKQDYALGYISSLPRHKIYSLAGSLRLSRKTFIGLFAFETFWWVLGAPNGAIAEDACYATQAEAENAVQDLRNIYAADAELITCKSAGETIRYLQQQLRPEYPLEYLANDPAAKSLRLKLAGLAFLLLCAVAAWNLYGLFQEREMEIARRNMLLAAEQNKQNLLEHPEIYFQRTWQDAPSPRNAGGQCIPAMLDQALVEEAWMLTGMSCLPGTGLTLTYNHSRGGSFTKLPAKARLISPTSAQGVLPLASLPKNPAVSLLSRDDAGAELYQVVQELNANLEKLSWEAPEQTRRDGVLIFAPWQRGQFTLANAPMQSFLDLSIFKFLSLPGLIVSEITWSKSGWTIQGVIYAKP